MSKIRKHNIVKIFIICLITFLNGQTNLNNKLIKDAAKKLGVSPSQIKKMIPKGSLGKGLENDFNKVELPKNIIDEKSIGEIKSSFKSDKSNIPILDKKILDDQVTKLDRTVESDSLIEKFNIKDKYFGYNVFEGDPELFQKSLEISTDGNYQIGPGDEIIIMLWGDTEFNRNYLVSKDGYLFIENVGQVFVNGLSIDKLESKLFKLLKKSYSSLDPASGNATTFFDVSLGAIVLRPVRVFILGELIQPGAYNVKSTTSLFNSLYYCNGPNLNGSLRSIKLIKGGTEVAEIDYYEYLLSGKKTNDVKLQRDDVVFIPPRGKTIELKGEIKRPSIYELKNTEMLYDLINIGGGLRISTYMKRAQIKRIVPPNERVSTDVDRTLIDVNLYDVMSKKIEVELVDGDEITFYSISDIIQNTVNVQGAVNMPGIYDIGDGLDIISLIDKANGLVGDIFLERVDVIRTNQDFSKTQITIDLQKALASDPAHNINLKSNDKITFYNSSTFGPKGSVSISGYVLNPATTILRRNLKVEDLIFFGGGFKNEKRLNELYLERADLFRVIDGNNKKIISFRLDSVLAGRGIAKKELIDGDEIKVYSKYEVMGVWPKIVKISGTVKHPGTYPLYENMRIKDLLRISGGFQDSVFVRRIFMNRADLYRKNLKTGQFYIEKFNLAKVLDTLNDKENFKLIPYDEVVIYSKSDFFEDDSVKIFGVIKPGIYQHKKNMTLGDLILESGGIDKKFSKVRVEISRIIDDPKAEKMLDVIYFDIKTVKIDKYSTNSQLRYKINENDIVRVRPYSVGTIEKTVTVSGEVNLPGIYPITHKDEKVSDILKRAGGLSDESYPLASKLVRDDDTVRVSFNKIMRNPRSKLNFVVFDNDEIIIESKPNIIRILGSVNSPGLYQFIPNQRFKGYLKMAGGLSPDASRSASYVKYPNGISKRLSYFSSPVVKDGSIIFIGTKEEVEPFNFTEWAGELTAIWADLSQAYLVLTLIVNQNSNQ